MSAVRLQDEVADTLMDNPWLIFAGVVIGGGLLAWVSSPKREPTPPPRDSSFEWDAAQNAKHEDKRW